MKSMALSRKLLLSFLFMAVVLLIVGGLSFINLQKVDHSMGQIEDSEPLVEASLESAISVMESTVVLTELSPMAEANEMDALWKRHEHAVESFDIYTKAIIAGGDTPTGKVKATEDEHLRSLVQDAQKTHATQFVPLVESAKEHVSKLHEDIAATAKASNDLDTAVAGLDKEMSDAIIHVEGLEESRTKSGTTAEEIMKNEVRWIATLRRAEISVLQSFVLLEEMALADNLKEAEELRKRFDRSSEEFGHLTDTLLNGGTVGQSVVPKISDSGLVREVTELRKYHTEKFLPKAAALMAAHTDLLETTAKVNDERRRLDKVSHQLVSKLEEVEAAAKHTAETIGAAAHTQAKTAEIEAAAGVGIGFILAVILGVSIARAISRPIQQVVNGMSAASEEVASASGNVSSASQELAAGATEQASNIEETSSAMEEMAAMAGQNAEYADTAHKVGQESRSAVAKGTQNLEHMVNSMAEIEVAFNKVSKIVRSIEEIAFQTNLLSLNASLEAAGAGEHGKRFAVVADEVRNLSLKAEEAARETVSLINDANDRVRTGSQTAEVLHESFESIESSADKVASLLSEIQAASREQARGADQVGRAMVQLDQATQGNASAAEETAAASEELNAQAVTLQDLMESLLTIVVGNAEANRQLSAYKSSTNRSNGKPNGSYNGKTSSVKPLLKDMASNGKTNGKHGDRELVGAEVGDSDEGGFRQF